MPVRWAAEGRAGIRSVVALATAMWVLTVLSGCQEEDTGAREVPSPEETAEAWARALEDERWGEACDLSSTGNVRFLGGRAGCVRSLDETFAAKRVEVAYPVMSLPDDGRPGRLFGLSVDGSSPSSGFSVEPDGDRERVHFESLVLR